MFPLRGQLDGSLLVLVQGDALESADRRAARQRLVTPGFFEAMGVPVLAGRDFNADDRRTTAPVAIVNGEFVRRYLNGKDPLRTSFAIGYPVVDTKVFRTIVGVVGNIRYRSIAEDPEPSFYVTQGQFPFPRGYRSGATTCQDAGTSCCSTARLLPRHVRDACSTKPSAVQSC